MPCVGFLRVPFACTACMSYLGRWRNPDRLVVAHFVPGPPARIRRRPNRYRSKPEPARGDDYSIDGIKVNPSNGVLEDPRRGQRWRNQSDGLPNVGGAVSPCVRRRVCAVIGNELCGQKEIAETGSNDLALLPIWLAFSAGMQCFVPCSRQKRVENT